MMSLHESKAAEGQAMYTKVMRNQFEIKDGAMIHTPTGAEFTPVTGTLDSILIWTGDIGGIMPTGERYRYADVFAVMKEIWQQGFQPACRFESRGKRHLQRSKGAKLSASGFPG